MTLADLDFTPEQREFRSDFLRRTGYGESDILSLSFVNRMVLTRNGGIYRVEENEVVRLAGPAADPDWRM